MTHTVKIANSDKNVVGQVALGLMMLTWTADPVPHDQAFEAIKAGIDTLPPGVKMLLNSAEFYDNNASTSNLDLLADFFEKYPDYAAKTFLIVKGGLVEDSFDPDLSSVNLRRSVDRISKHLRGRKKLDLFEPSRVDPKVPIEDAVKTLAGFIKEGKFDYIGLSECSADTLRKANAIHPIAVVEIEVSPWSYEEETKKVIATAKELGIVVVAYAPLGRGFLTGRIKSRADIPEGDMRLRFTRFSEENIQKNLKVVEELKKIADEKGITSAQLSLAWVGSLGSHIVPIPGSSKKLRVLENLETANISLMQEEVEVINKLLTDSQISGDRYFGEGVKDYVWG